MLPSNKRKRATVKAEPPESDYDSNPSVSDNEARGPTKRVKLEVKADVKVEELSDDDFIIALSDHEMGNVSDDLANAACQSVRRSAGGRPPRRGVDVGRLYEEVGVDSLPRSLGQVVKEEVDDAKPLVLARVKAEEGVGESPLRVTDYVRRVAAVRAAELLRSDDDRGVASVALNADTTEPHQEHSCNKHARRFTPDQRQALRVQFDEDPYPDRPTKEELSRHLGVGYDSVHSWFRSERIREGVTASGDDLARSNCRFGPVMYDKLVAQFELNPYPSTATIQTLAEEAGATELCESVSNTTIRFQNRRRRAKRQPSLKRLQLSSTQRSELEAVLQTTPYPDRQARETFAKQMNCTEQQIRTWFRSARRHVGIFRGDNARDLCAFGPGGYDKLIAQFEIDSYPDRATKTALASQLVMNQTPG